MLGDREVGWGQHEAPNSVEHGDGLGVDIEHAGLVILYQWGQRLFTEYSFDIMRNVVKVRVVVNIVTRHGSHRIWIVCWAQGSRSKRCGAHSSRPEEVPDDVIGAVIGGEAVSQTLGIEVDWELSSGAAVPLTILLPT